MTDRDIIINETIDKLSELTSEDFHGYRSEVWNVISMALDKQETLTILNLTKLPNNLEKLRGI